VIVSLIANCYDERFRYVGDAAENLGELMTDSMARMSISIIPAATN
jgi:hypothetical protein